MNINTQNLDTQLHCDLMVKLIDPPIPSMVVIYRDVGQDKEVLGYLSIEQWEKMSEHIARVWSARERR